MYKKLILIVLGAVLTAGIAKAQLFLGGTIGLDSESGSTTVGTTTQNDPSAMTINFSPMVGFMLNNDFGIGARLGIVNSSTSREVSEGDKVETAKSSELEWSFGAFARYRTLKGDRLSMFLEGGMGILGGSGSSTYKATTTDLGSTFGFKLDVCPVLSYEFSNTFSVEVSSGLLRLGFVSKTKTTPSGSQGGGGYDDDDDYYRAAGPGYGEQGSSEIKKSTTKFGLGVNRGDLFNVGLTIKF